MTWGSYKQYPRVALEPEMGVISRRSLISSYMSRGRRYSRLLFFSRHAWWGRYWCLDFTKKIWTSNMNRVCLFMCSNNPLETRSYGLHGGVSFGRNVFLSWRGQILGWYVFRMDVSRGVGTAHMNLLRMAYMGSERRPLLHYDGDEEGVMCFWAICALNINMMEFRLESRPHYIQCGKKRPPVGWSLYFEVCIENVRHPRN